VNTTPSTANVPVRTSKILGATENDTLPGPEPLVAEVSVNQFAALAAVHGQPAAVEIIVDPAPPAAGKEADAGERLYAHPLA
jgi:hypothetical protein